MSCEPAKLKTPCCELRTPPATSCLFGEIGRALGLAIPEIIFINIDSMLGRNEPDAEIRHLLKASNGVNLALDYLPGSIMFDPAARDKASPLEASLAVWFDAFTQNVDRTARNANLLVWHRKIYFIDHGAALFFHHNLTTMMQKVESSFPEIKDHVLLPWASEIPQASAVAHSRLTPYLISDIVEQVPGDWFQAGTDESAVAECRTAYVDFFTRRLVASSIFEQEAIHAHARLF
jgi:hypothetical protein